MTGARRQPKTSTPNDVLFVAGEASGDRIAADIARALAPRDVRCWGMGGSASRAAKVDVHVDLRHTTAMGVGSVIRRLPSVVRAFAQLVRETQRRRPRAAVLVDYTEFNLRLARRLRSSRIPILWCVAPQVWAWRPARTQSIGRLVDRMATILPFEAAIWQRAGVDAHYVGHPALDAAPLPRADARATLGLAKAIPSVALLPGSRAHEVRKHTDVMLTSVCEVRRAGVAIDVRLAIASSLDAATRRWLVSRAEGAGIATFDADPARGASPWLTAFDASIAVSGTATLESALAGAPPVIIYRTSRLTAALARRLLQTPFIGLPNIVLGERAYPEIVHDVATTTVARALLEVLEQRSRFAQAADELRARLAPRANTFSTMPARFGARANCTVPLHGITCGERAASLLDDWLDGAPLRERLDLQTRDARRTADLAP